MLFSNHTNAQFVKKLWQFIHFIDSKVGMSNYFFKKKKEKKKEEYFKLAKTHFTDEKGQQNT